MGKVKIQPRILNLGTGWQEMRKCRVRSELLLAETVLRLLYLRGREGGSSLLKWHLGVGGVVTAI